jgi:hypothetical protein
MTRNGKIARLPHHIREQLNLRLRDGHKAKSILPWLNALPEVQFLLHAEFSDRPVTAGNLTEWKKGGYHDWEVHQHALHVARSLDDAKSLGNDLLPGSFAEKLSHWLALYYAGVARQALTEPDPKIRWARLRELCLDVSRLRRGDLQAERVALERDRFALTKSTTDAAKEKEFWAWTEREDIREKLYPGEEPGLSPETLAKIERELRLM